MKKLMTRLMTLVEVLLIIILLTLVGEIAYAYAMIWMISNLGSVAFLFFFPLPPTLLAVVITLLLTREKEVSTEE